MTLRDTEPAAPNTMPTEKVGSLKVKSGVKAGPSRRSENNKYGDHIGAYNFMVEISGVNAG